MPLLEIDYSVKMGENAVTEITARVFGQGDDNISIKCLTVQIKFW
ncbi:MAG: hypothetical protein WA130_04565 [Candidatus Methanoperedens sp.]